MPKKPIIISVATQKGGVGKTTTVVNLAHALTLKPCYKKVLVIDMDPQANASSILGKVHPEEQIKGVATLFDDAQKFAINCTVPSKYKNIDLMPSKLDLFASVNRLAPSNPAAFMCLDRKLDSATLSTYDFILIDCPPNIGGPCVANALTVSDYYITPIESSSIFSLNGLEQFMDAVSAMRGYTDHNQEMLGVLMTMYDSRLSICKTMLDALQQSYGSRLFESKIISSTDINKAHGLNRTVIDAFTRTKSARCYREFAVEVMQRCHLVSAEMQAIIQKGSPFDEEEGMTNG